MWNYIIESRIRVLYRDSPARSSHRRNDHMKLFRTMFPGALLGALALVAQSPMTPELQALIDKQRSDRPLTPDEERTYRTLYEERTAPYLKAHPPR